MKELKKKHLICPAFHFISFLKEITFFFYSCFLYRILPVLFLFFSPCLISDLCPPHFFFPFKFFYLFSSVTCFFFTLSYPLITSFFSSFISFLMFLPTGGIESFIVSICKSIWSLFISGSLCSSVQTTEENRKYQPLFLLKKQNA